MLDAGSHAFESGSPVFLLVIRELAMKTDMGYTAKNLLIPLLMGLTLSACCPSGVWQDNFGSIYQLLTLPIVESDVSPRSSFETVGSIDTMDMGCGVWQIRSPTAAEMPADHDQFDFIWVAENPAPNPADQCCSAVLFKGDSAGSYCDLLTGEYTNIGDKCTQSGSMYLQSLE